MESKQVKYPLGTLSKVEAMAFGQPGQRTFRIDLHAGPAFCSVWLEKEQLFQLGVYLRDIVAGLSAEDKARASQPQEAPWSGGEATIDFKAGQMALRHDGDTNSFYMQAHAQETEEAQEGEDDSVSFWITVGQAQALSEESLRICAAGRPICFLCGQPINPEGHVCPRANGHTVLEVG